ncbi:hypothetical protein R1flu_008300 [Riccia fluitans]|uniref:Uncharacterized protein n=1 Tax=Riccia fluitans TaxID=41844 RepID=A0ABD1YBH5_9MARC
MATPSKYKSSSRRHLTGTAVLSPRRIELSATLIPYFMITYVKEWSAGGSAGRSARVFLWLLVWILITVICPMSGLVAMRTWAGRLSRPDVVAGRFSLWRC